MPKRLDIKGTLLKVLGNSRTFYAVLVAGVLVRIGFLIILVPTSFYSDAMAYHSFARKLVRGLPYRASWPPGLPLLLAGPYALFDPDRIVARFVMLAVYVIFTVLLFLFVKRLSGTEVANLSVLIFSFYPLCIYYSLTPLTQLVIAAVLVGTALATLSLLGKNRWSVAIILGFLLGVLTLVRASGTLILLAVPTYFIFKKGYRLKAGAVLLIAILPVVLWCYNVYRATDRVVFINTANATNFFIGNNEFTPVYRTWYFGSHGVGNDKEGLTAEGFAEAQKSIREYPKHERQLKYIDYSIRYIIKKPHLFAIRTFSRIRVFFGFDIYLCAILLKYYGWSKIGAFLTCGMDAVIYLGLLFGSVFSLFLVRPLYDKKEASVVLLGFPFLYAFPYFLAFSHPTYHFPILPFLSVFFSILVADFLRNRPGIVVRVKASSRLNLVIFVVVIVFLVLIQIEWFLSLAGCF
jgi:4-amino-4-deoxy-L-arabinose transferase-like glycosyltransferase